MSVLYVVHDTFIRRLSDEALIPIDEGNADYVEYAHAVNVDPAVAVDADDFVEGGE